MFCCSFIQMGFGFFIRYYEIRMMFCLTINPPAPPPPPPHRVIYCFEMTFHMDYFTAWSLRRQFPASGFCAICLVVLERNIMFSSHHFNWVIPFDRCQIIIFSMWSSLVNNLPGFFGCDMCGEKVCANTQCVCICLFMFTYVLRSNLEFHYVQKGGEKQRFLSNLYPFHQY